MRPPKATQRRRQRWRSLARPRRRQHLAAASPDMGDKLAQLKQLGELRESGVLTDAEFGAQKAQHPERLIGFRSAPDDRVNEAVCDCR